MKILPVANTSVYVNGHKQFCSANKNNANSYRYDTKPASLSLFPSNLAFLGYDVHILDGGSHADNMEHFAKSLSPDMDVRVHYVKTNPKSEHDKQMSSLLQELKKIPSKIGRKDEYIALPGLCNAPLQSIEAQYKNVMGTSIRLTPENIKANKAKLLEFLKRISENPNKYSKYIGYMDPMGQGMKYVYPVIQEINRLTDSGYKVYISAGHPEYQTLKWLADENGKKPELQHYIATGRDTNGDVAKMRSYIRSEGWYDFNLLNLSNAHIVNLKDESGSKDYMFAAYDGTITDGARGVYNFYPVRDELGRVRGYSYSGRYAVDYPYSEFPANGQLENLLKFVGKKYTDVLASKKQAEEFKELYKKSPEEAKEKFSHVLFNVNDVFTQGEIERQKIALKGRYVNSSLKLFFDRNSFYDEITFPNCDCEGSGRPSVLSMWGSCFSVFNAIKDDIELAKKKETATSVISLSKTPVAEIAELMKKAEEAGHYSFKYKQAEDYYNNAIELCKIHGIQNPKPHIALGELHLKNDNLDYASGCFNNAIDMMSKNLNDRYLSKVPENSLNNIRQGKDTYKRALKEEEQYKKDRRQYDNSGFLHKLFNDPPKVPSISSKDNKDCVELYKSVQELSTLFDRMAVICSKKGESYPARVCRVAAKEIKECSNRGTKVVLARANGIQYIGDIFDEISAN